MNLWRSISTVSLLTLASRITGMLRETIIYATFGTNAMTDAFNVAFRIPNMLRRLFAEGAFSQAFVPILAASKEQNTPEQTKDLLDAVASTLAFALLLTCIIGIIGAPVFVYLLASGLQNGPGFDIAIVLTRWMFPYIVFMSLVALGAGVLNTWGKFAVPAAAPLMLNIAMIAAGLIIYFGAGEWMTSYGWQPIYILGFGVLIGGLLQLLVILWGLRSINMIPKIRLGYTSLKTAIHSPGTRRVLSLMLPAILGVSVAQISLLINTQIASHLEAQGSISWLTAADRLMEFPTAILGVALGVVLLPQLSASLASKSQEKYSALLDWGLRLVLLLGMPCAIALLFFSKALVALLFHYGAFSDLALEQTSFAVQAYGIGILGLIAIKVLAPGFYAQQDIRTPVRVAVIVLITTQIMNMIFIFFLHLQHAGLALSIALGALMNATLLLHGLKKRGSYHPHRGWLRFTVQVVIACAILATFLWFCNSQFQWELLKEAPIKRIGIILGIIISAIVVYFAALMLCGCKLKTMLHPQQ